MRSHVLALALAIVGVAPAAHAQITYTQAGLLMYDCLQGDVEACETAAKAGPVVFTGDMDEGGITGTTPHFRDVLIDRIAPTHAEMIAQARTACDTANTVACTELGHLLNITAEEPTMESFAVFAKACDAGNAVGCSELAAIALWTNGRTDQSDALAFYNAQSQACDAGDQTACVTQARLNTRLEGVTRDRAIWFDQLEAACDANNARACRYLGDAYGFWGGVEYAELRQGAGAFLRSPLKTSVAYHEKACDLGEPIACSELGSAYALGDGVSEDDEKARIYDRRACNLDGKSGCVSLMQEPYWASEQAQTTLNAACAEGDFVACYALADPSDRDTLIQICLSGEATACSDVAAAYLSEGDRAAADRYAFAACDAKSEMGCLLIGEILAAEGASSAELALAVKYFSRVCIYNELEKACRMAGAYYENNPSGGAPDLERAREYYGYGCYEGNEQSCEHLDRLDRG